MTTSQGRKGALQKDKVSLHVMRRGSFGAAYASKRSGEWEFVSIARRQLHHAATEIRQVRECHIKLERK